MAPAHFLFLSRLRKYFIFFLSVLCLAISISILTSGKSYAITYSAGECYDDGGDDFTYLDLSECRTYTGNPNNQCFQVPWTFKYAARCRVSLGANEPECSFNYEYEYNECNTEDRCWGSSTGASGFDSAGRIWPGICSASSYNGSDPNSACISGGHYKQCCSLPAPGYVPTTYCSNGICPAGYKTAPLDTDCDTPSQPTATTVPLR